MGINKLSHETIEDQRNKEWSPNIDCSPTHVTPSRLALNLSKYGVNAIEGWHHDRLDVVVLDLDLQMFKEPIKSTQQQAR